MPTEFTPFWGLLGGALIGLASASLLLATGKIAGISGILGRSLFPVPGDLAWRLAFLLGLPLGSWIATRANSDALGFEITHRRAVLLLAGVLVGFGTQLGNGCTSGHGVCGIARGSRRSIVATVLFMTTAALTVVLVRHGLGVR